MGKQKQKKEKVKSTGFGLRLSFAIIIFITAVYCVLVNVLAGTSGALLIMLLGFSALMFFLGILQLIAAIKGKTKKWANTLSIVIGAPFCLAILGVLAVVGGVRGKRALLKAEAAANEVAAQSVETLENTEAKAADIRNEATADAEKAEKTGNIPEPIAVQEPLEYIQPKLSPKAKKGMFITVIVSYSLLLIAGILFVALPATGKIFSGIGICEEISARAYAVTIGTMWLALLPTIGYYVAFVSPVNLSKTKKIIIAVICGVLSIALCAVFFVIINSVKIDGFAVKEYYENEDTWFIPASMVVAVIGLALCYALTFFKLNPAKIKTEKPENCGEGFFAVLKHVFAYLIYGIMKLVKAILTFKEKQPEIFLFVSTFLFTWLVYFTSFVFSIIMIAVFVGVACMYFFGVIHFAYSPSVGRVTTKQITVDGKVLTKNDNIAGNGYSEVYTDEYGNVYYSNDGGKSVIGSVDRNIEEKEAELTQIRAEEAERRRRDEEEAERLRRLNELNNNQN